MVQEPPPCTPSAIHRESRSVRAPSPSPTPSLQATPSTTTASTIAAPSPNNQLSASEPFLRFPRPQGNTQLANWISTSNPDIMRITSTSTDDNGLSDSAYELVSGTDTEDWSEDQDGHYTESISDSVASLDLQRPDDVHSLAGTEQTYDDESVAEDEAYVQAILHTPEETADDSPPPQPSHKAEIAAETETESDDEVKSRSSLEYTRQNLSTPSIPTPEASGIVERPAEPTPAAAAEDANEDLLNKTKKWILDTWEDAHTRTPEYFRTFVHSVLFVCGIAIAASLLTPRQSSVAPSASTAVPAITLTSSVVSTSPSKISESSALATTASASGLVPLENVLADEWLFSAKRPELFMSKHHGDYLIHIKPPIKFECLSITAQRGVEPVQVHVNPVKEGILVKFPYKESRGTVRLEVSSRCRPKVKQILEIPFSEKGFVEEALDLAKNLASDFTERVPVAAQEAERRIEEAKRSIEAASGNAILASDNFVKALTTRFHEAHRSLSYIKADARGRMRHVREHLTKQMNGVTEQVIQRLPDPRNVQESFQLGLLDAQLSAKIWWLKAIGAKEEHEHYKRKATELLMAKKAEAHAARQSRHDPVQAWLKSNTWNRVFREARCRRKAAGQSKGTHQCDFLA